MLQLLSAISPRFISASHQQQRRIMQALAASSRENVPSEQPAAKVQRLEPLEQLRVKRLSENATLPKRGSAGAAGYDLARQVIKGELPALTMPVEGHHVG